MVPPTVGKNGDRTRDDRDKKGKEGVGYGNIVLA